MSEIKSRMAKLGMTQVDMILELQQRGIAIQPPMMCSILRGVYTYPKASRFSQSARKFSLKKRMNLSDEQVNDLARPLVGIITKFYEDPKNEEEFNKWLLCVEKQRKES